MVGCFDSIILGIVPILDTVKYNIIEWGKISYFFKVCNTTATWKSLCKGSLVFIRESSEDDNACIDIDILILCCIPKQ